MQADGGLSRWRWKVEFFCRQMVDCVWSWKVEVFLQVDGRLCVWIWKVESFCRQMVEAADGYGRWRFFLQVDGC